jgi:hypothetical protein
MVYLEINMDALGILKFSCLGERVNVIAAVKSAMDADHNFRVTMYAAVLTHLEESGQDPTLFLNKVQASYAKFQEMKEKVKDQNKPNDN